MDALHKIHRSMIWPYYLVRLTKKKTDIYIYPSILLAGPKSGETLLLCLQHRNNNHNNKTTFCRGDDYYGRAKRTYTIYESTEKGWPNKLVLSKCDDADMVKRIE